ncbi:PD-(D/E)XK nuclease family protein [Halarchaeum nitratireducens]|uniref:PD-(D/E)XK endonuclease-like domain-containing protein n=1 Tax=Halarchaeum nitratireducens TaxID=489913 RepID=A0A830GFW6_9EURY|nr:PD-(D/E)XK nuclease family protein [Halarchaeum nitratireducens]GGN24907.1 hypothetical protein GCM10009021_28450 [Halarchaeum nitratireducens]
MSDTRTLLSGPDPDGVTEQAFAWAAETAGEEPGSVLCLTQSGERATTLSSRWRADHDQLRLTCTTLDGYVSECFERATGELAQSTLTRAQRFRLVEAAIEQYGAATSDGPFAAVESPSNDLIDQVQGIFSLLEYAGYDSPDAIEGALSAAGHHGSDAVDPDALYGAFRETPAPGEKTPLDAQATAFADLYTEYERLRGDLHPSWRRTVADQYLTLLDDDALLDAVPDAADVVVLDGLTRLAPAEREIVARLSRAYPTVAVLPLVHDSLDGVGIDAGLERALSVYRTLDFDLDYRTSRRVDDVRLDTVRQLYEPSTDSETHTADQADLTFAEPATEREEVRATARRIRDLLERGVDPSDIGVVVTDRATYRSVLAEVLPAYDVPFTFVNEIGIEQTLVGDAARALLDLAGDAPSVAPLRTLAANTLGSLTQVGIEPNVIERTAEDTPDDTLENLLDTLDELDDPGADETASALRTLRDALDGETQSLASFVDDLRTILSDLGVGDAVDDYQARSDGSRRPEYERSAWRAIERVLASFEGVATHLADEDPAERVRRALLAELVSGPRQQPGYTRVYPLAEAEMASFEHCFVLGLTTSYFPTESDTMRFFEAVNDADEEFGREHTGRRARAIFGTLLTGSADATLSVPKHTVDGTEHVPAPVVSELERYVDRDATDTEGSDPLPRVVSEDVQEAYGSWASRETFDDPERATEPLDAATGLSETARGFATQGATASWRRSKPGVSPHDAQVSSILETVPDLGESYSPSALEDYARCPFVFYAKRVLDFDEDYGDEEGITRADRGTYVHRVLADFYRRLRDDADEPVDLTAHDADALEAALLEAALDHLDDLGEIETPFSERTVGRLLSGLGGPAENDYYHSGPASSDGLLARFLDAERERQTGVKTQPTYFEGALGVHRDGVELLSDDPTTVDTPDGPVDVRGIADRVDVASSDANELHVRDYKTGSTPSRKDVVSGLKLQLPLYGLALETALERRTGESHETVAGSYYTLKSPDDIDPVVSQVASREAADPESGPPLVPSLSQSWRLPLDTRAEFRAFVHDVTATRVGRIATAAEAGAFQPTLLSESVAGCEDCAFRHTCDVRHHTTQDTLDELDESTHYISERATDEDVDLDAYADGGAN